MPVNSYKFLRLTEYAVVAASVVGAIATISTQQLAYIAVPLAFSISLNLVGRYQQEKLSPRNVSTRPKKRLISSYSRFSGDLKK